MTDRRAGGHQQGKTKSKRTVKASHQTETGFLLPFSRICRLGNHPRARFREPAVL